MRDPFGAGREYGARDACPTTRTARLKITVEISGRVANHAALRGLCQPRKGSGRYDGRFQLCQGSSVVEQGTHKPLVGSSTLPPGTILFGRVAKCVLLERAAPKAFGAVWWKILIVPAPKVFGVGREINYSEGSGIFA